MYGNLPGDKYRSRDMELAQQLIAQSENNGTITSGLASILKKGMAGFLMGEDKKKSDAYNKALTEGLATPYSPAMEAQSAVPYSDFNTGEFEADEGLNIDMEFSGDGSNPEILKSLPEGGNLLEARDAQPADGPMRGAQRSLRALLATGPNERAQSALLPLTMAQAGQDRAAQLAQTARANQVLDATTLFDRQSKLKKIDVKNAQKKFGSPQIIKWPSSSTGWAKVGMNQLGQQRVFGEAPAPQTNASRLEVATAMREIAPLTQDQAKAGGFALRMERSRGNIDKILAGPDGKLGTNDDFDPANVRDRISSNVPVLGNYAMSNDGQLYEQAKRDWVTANLRKESGAVIGVEEMENEIIKYFPVAGDNKQTIAQKQRSRQVAEAAMKTTAGEAYKRMKKSLGGEEGWSILKEDK